MGSQKRQGEEDEWVVSSTRCLLLAFSWSALNQTAWLVLVLWILTPPPLAPEPPRSASFLFVWLKTWPIFTPREGRKEKQEKEQSTRHKDRGEVGGEKAKGETLNTPELGLIYFINRDYKFNLQTRGQNFSLTRGPWRTSGLGDHSYYWLHISICLWCSMSAFLPPLSPSYFLAARLILIVAIEQSIVCL